MTARHDTGAGTDLRRDILTTLLPGFDGTEAPAWVLRPPRGGPRRRLPVRPEHRDAAQLRALNASLRAANPLAVVAIDEEGGDVTRLFYDRGAPYPGNALLGRIDDLDLTERVARAVGEALVATGCTVDLRARRRRELQPRQPRDRRAELRRRPRARRAAHGAAWVRGLQSTGVAASAKHFPGHGDTATDSHLALPVVDLPLETLRERELVPFRAAIAAGTRTIMTSHILLPAPRRGAARHPLPAHRARPAPRGAGVRGRHRHRRPRHAGGERRARHPRGGRARPRRRLRPALHRQRQHRRPARRDRRGDRRGRRVAGGFPPSACARPPPGCARSARPRPPSPTPARGRDRAGAPAAELARIAAAFEVTDAARARLAASAGSAPSCASTRSRTSPSASRPGGRSRSLPRRGSRPGSTTRRSSPSPRATASPTRRPLAGPVLVVGKDLHRHPFAVARDRRAARGARRRRDDRHGLAVGRPRLRRRLDVRRVAPRRRGAHRLRRRTPQHGVRGGGRPAIGAAGAP